MGAGERDRQIRLERFIPGPRTPSGQRTGEWVLLAEPWARLVENRGQEIFTSNAKAAEATRMFQIPWPYGLEAEVTPSENFRIVYDGKAHDVVAGPVEIGRRKEIQLFAKVRKDEEQHPPSGAIGEGPIAGGPIAGEAVPA